MVLTAGTLLDGKFEVVKPLGAGGFGEVFLARQAAFDRMVAVKTLRGQEVDEETETRFYREAKLLSMLSHPNIATFLGYGISGGIRYTVLEYIQGETLHGRISERGHLSLHETVAVAKEIASALAHAHNLGIVHRDLKPANVIFATTLPGEPVKLIDFGLAHVETPVGQRLTQEGLAVGTALYMSPEQCLGKEVDGRSDLYALGCILFQCLKGVPPFDDDSSVGIMFKHLNDPIPACEPAHDSQFYDILVTLLAKDPAERYQNADELLDALAKCDLHKRSSARIPAVVQNTNANKQQLSKPLLVGCILLAIATMGGICWKLSKSANGGTQTNAPIPPGPLAAEIRAARDMPIGNDRARKLREISVKAAAMNDFATAEQVLLPEYTWVKQRCAPLEVARFEWAAGAAARRNNDDAVAHQMLDDAVKDLTPMVTRNPGISNEAAQVMMERYALARKLNERYMMLHASGNAHEAAGNADPGRWTWLRHQTGKAFVEELLKARKVSSAAAICERALDAIESFPHDVGVPGESFWARLAAQAELARDDNSRAREFALRSIAAAKQANSNEDIILGYYELASVDARLNRNQEAIKDLKEALTVMEEHHIRHAGDITRRMVRDKLIELGSTDVVLKQSRKKANDARRSEETEG